MEQKGLHFWALIIQIIVSILLFSLWKLVPCIDMIFLLFLFFLTILHSSILNFFVATLWVRWGDSCLLLTLETGQYIFLGLTLVHICKFWSKIWLGSWHDFYILYGGMLDKHRLIFLMWFSGTCYRLLLKDQ